MIIVTQDGNIAIFNKLVEIYKTFGDKKSITIEAEKINDGYINLGEYATEERAKEVLEEIIEKYEHVKDCECDRIYFNTLENFTYKMPKE